MQSKGNKLYDKQYTVAVDNLLCMKNAVNYLIFKKNKLQT